MLPIEIEQEIIKLPDTENHNIVIVTGNSIRHNRFAYRIQKEFGKSVVAWYELDNSVSPKFSDTSKKEKQIEPSSRIRKILYLIGKELPLSLSKYGVFTTLKRIYRLGMRVTYNSFLLRKYYKDSFKAEKKLFEQEILDLKRFSILKPIKINPKDVNETSFINEIKKLDLYFFLTLGGPLYKKSLLETIRGVAINQHAGHSPKLKGVHTTEWALYHRNLNYISNTVHITTSGADAGPILRRSNPCIFPNDDINTIFVRVVALGTELMIEVVKEIIKNKNVRVFIQPRTVGRTYLGKEFKPYILRSLIRDFKADWLKDELNRLKDF